MKILAIGAHPDDIEIFMFGFLSCCKEMGHKISAIVEPPALQIIRSVFL